MREIAPRVRFGRVKFSMTGLPIRLLALFFVAALADLPVICAEERAAPAAAVEDTGPLIRGIVSAAQSSAVLRTISPDSDCACPCHHTFGGQAIFTLSPLIRLPEVPDSAHCSRTFPPARGPEHPPQNLA